MINVLVADDQELVRTGFRLILDAEPDLCVVGEAVDGRDAVRQVRRTAPDVVLMDVRMPVLDGIAATRELTATGRLDYDGYEPVRLSLVGEFVKNIAFDQASVAQFAVNNKGAGGVYEGGDTAWMVNFIVGDAALEKFGDWQAILGYRYVESDSVVDGLTDSDFGGGGTNLKGFTLGANMALSKAVRIGARWMSADQIAGPTYRNDILQFDLNAKF